MNLEEKTIYSQYLFKNGGPSYKKWGGLLYLLSA